MISFAAVISRNNDAQSNLINHRNPGKAKEVSKSLPRSIRNITDIEYCMISLQVMELGS
jgi:hypothetical protein